MDVKVGVLHNVTVEGVGVIRSLKDDDGSAQSSKEWPSSSLRKSDLQNWFLNSG